MPAGHPRRRLIDASRDNLRPGAAQQDDDDGGGGELVVVGRLGRPHGLRGHVRAWATGPTLPALTPPARVVLEGPSGRRAADVVELWRDGRRLVLLIDGVDSRTGARGLTGHDVLVPRTRLPGLAGEDEFYVADLVGFRVEVEGIDVGELTDVLERPANDVLEVRASSGRIVLVPFVAAAVGRLDHAARRVALEPWAWQELE